MRALWHWNASLWCWCMTAPVLEPTCSHIVLRQCLSPPLPPRHHSITTIPPPCHGILSARASRTSKNRIPQSTHNRIPLCLPSETPISQLAAVPCGSRSTVFMMNTSVSTESHLTECWYNNARRHWGYNRAIARLWFQDSHMLDRQMIYTRHR